MNQVHRAPWREFPPVFLHTNGATLKSHRSYVPAKAGDPASALQLAEDLLQPQKILVDFDVVVPVMQIDNGQHNAIPKAAAYLLAIQLNRNALLTVYQTNEVSRTRADAPTRILGQPHFGGVLQPGQRVLLLDDVVTYGTTLANLRGWLEHCGAKVVGATSLAAGFGSTNLAPPVEVLDRLADTHPAHAELAETFGFNGYSWTNREARFLLDRSPEQFQKLLSYAKTLYPDRAQQLSEQIRTGQARGLQAIRPAHSLSNGRSPQPRSR